MTKSLDPQNDQLMLPLICIISFSVSVMSITTTTYLPIALSKNGFELSTIGPMFLAAGLFVWLLNILVGVVGDHNFKKIRTSHLFLLISIGICPFATLAISLLDPGLFVLTLSSIFGLKAAAVLIPFVLNIFMAQIASNALERLRFFLLSSASSIAGLTLCLIATSVNSEFDRLATDILFVPAILFLICTPLLWNLIPATASPLPSGSLINFLRNIKSDKSALLTILFGFASNTGTWRSSGFIHDRFASLYLMASLLLLLVATLALARFVRTRELTIEAVLSRTAKWAAITSAFVLVGILALGDIATLVSETLHFTTAGIFSVTLLALIGDIAANRKTTTRLHNFSWYFFLFGVSTGIGSLLSTTLAQFAKASEGYENQIMSAIALIIWSSIVWIVRRVELSPHRPGV